MFEKETMDEMSREFRLYIANENYEGFAQYIKDKVHYRGIEIRDNIITALEDDQVSEEQDIFDFFEENFSSNIFTILTDEPLKFKDVKTFFSQQGDKKIDYCIDFLQALTVVEVIFCRHTEKYNRDYLDTTYENILEIASRHFNFDLGVACEDMEGIISAIRNMDTNPDILPFSEEKLKHDGTNKNFWIRDKSKITDDNVQNNKINPVESKQLAQQNKDKVLTT